MDEVSKGMISVIVAIAVANAILVGIYGIYLQETSQEEVKYYEVYDYRYAAVPNNLTNQTEYYFQVELMADELEQVIDSTQPFAWHLWNENEIRSIEDIEEILEKEQGVCRHKSAVAFWLIKYLEPESEVKVVSGYEYGTPGITYQWSKEFDCNHIWLEMNGEIVDFAINGTYYTPYYEVTLRRPTIPVIAFEKRDIWELYYALNYSNIQKQYESDIGRSFTESPRLPWEDPKNKQII